MFRQWRRLWREYKVKQSLKSVRQEVDRLGRIINAPRKLLDVYSNGGDCEVVMQIEKHGDGYHYVTTERGVERERVIADDLHEILYRVFDHVTFRMAGDYELQHRIPGQDSRRLLWKYQQELLGRLNSEWAQRCQQENDEILFDHPFNDGL